MLRKKNRSIEQNVLLLGPEVGDIVMMFTSALCHKGVSVLKGIFFTDKTGLKILVFINAMIFAFTTFVTNPPLYGKIASKV